MANQSTNKQQQPQTDRVLSIPLLVLCLVLVLAGLVFLGSYAIIHTPGHTFPQMR